MASWLISFLPRGNGLTFWRSSAAAALRVKHRPGILDRPRSVHRMVLPFDDAREHRPLTIRSLGFFLMVSASGVALTPWQGPKLAGPAPVRRLADPFPTFNGI